LIHTIELRSTKTTELIDITVQIRDLAGRYGPLDGICCLYVPHTTAGITINENADPTVREDILMVLNSLIPAAAPYRHAEGNSPAHIKAMLTGTALSVMIESGRLVLGRWQGIFFCEYDGPRRRQVNVKFLSG